MVRSQLPLNALRAFEASARHLSFTKAAAELHVTPAAVGHQVKALEDYLGVTLFRRLNRALRMTDAGLACLPLLTEGFDRLNDAVRAAKAQEQEDVLRVNVAPTLAVKWLVPRLSRLETAHPRIVVEAPEVALVLGNALSQLGHPGHRGVLVVAGLHRRGRGVPDEVGPVEVGEALAQVDGVVLVGEGCDLSEDGRAEGCEATGERGTHGGSLAARGRGAVDE